MEDYFTEMRLSRAFACEFDGYLSWCQRNNVYLPPELVNCYNELKKHYEVEISKELS